ncbi:MAG TPA: efflux RND transporter periplasmic adaptor subunit [Rhodanobacter sp.]
MKSSFLRTPVLCLSLLALAACKGKDQGPPQMPPPQVGVLRAQPQSSPLTKDLVGRLSPYRSADVRARVPGVLLKRSYDEGTDVRKGQVLFQIDPAPLKAVLGSSLASLAQAQATLTNNKIAAQRAHSLAPQGYISKSDLDTADANARTAAAAVQQMRANVESARINLSYTNVTSPIDGRAGQQQVTEGALVGSGDTTLLTTVDQLDPLYVNFTLSSADFNQMRSAQSSGNVTLSAQDQTHVQVALPDGTRYDQQGTLDFSGAAVSQSTGAINLRAVLPNPRRILLPGQYVILKANLGERNKVFLIPQQAIQRDTIGAFAMVVGADGKVVRKNVDADQSSGNNWIITKGLAAGDQVIVSGLQQVKEGEPAKASAWQPGQEDKNTASGQGAASGKPESRPADNSVRGGDKPAAKQ